MSNKILNHPNKEVIIKKLLNGESVKNVESWLAKEYSKPKEKKYRISFVTLQHFRKNYLNLEGDVLESIKQAKEDDILSNKEVEKKATIAGSNAYQEKINVILNEKIDVTRKLIEMEALISSRLEYYFNTMQTGSSLQVDKVFLDYIKAQQDIMRDWKKLVEGMADKKIEHNININIINEQITVLKSVVYETLRDLDPKLIPVFMEKINAKLNVMNYNSNEYNDYSKSLEIIDADYEE